MAQRETWTDERGKEVKVFPFISHLYMDQEARELTERVFAFARGQDIGLPFSFHSFLKGSYEGGFFGKAEIESLVERILRICALVNGIVGIPKQELFDFLVSGSHLGSGGEQWFIDELIEYGILREKWVAGVLVVFLTDKALAAYRCSR